MKETRQANSRAGIGVMAVGVLAVIAARPASASIVYQVNRTVGAGTVVGFIETDGTIGTLASANITDWSLTLTAPNLLGGPIVTIEKSLSGQTFVSGPGTTATATDLSFDFGTPRGWFLLQGGADDLNDFWCLEIAGCTAAGFGESIGYDTSGINTVTEHESNFSGVVVFASVPAPGTFALLGLGGLVATRRRR